MTNLQLIQNINPKIVKYNDSKYYLAINSFLGFDSNPAYTLFLSINDKIFDGTNDIVIFLHSLQTDDIDILSSNLASGLDGKYVYGEDYSISYSLYSYLASYNSSSPIALLSNVVDNKYIFPDFIGNQFDLINTDNYQTVADTNLAYFYSLNKLIDSSLSEEELKNFMRTFCNIILENTTLTDFSDINNIIYKNVLTYYGNGGTDDTVTMLNLILNGSSLVSTGSQVSCCDAYTTSSSGANTNSTANNVSSSTLSDITAAQQTVSCKDLYINAMYLYLQKMLSDVHFYCDWFRTEGEDGEYYPNLVLIEKLKELFNEFIDLDFNLSFNTSGKGGHECKCDGKLKYNANLNDENYNILNNFLKILGYVENDTIEENCNRIKVYGQEFAILLPYLMFA